MLKLIRRKIKPMMMMNVAPSKMDYDDDSVKIHNSDGGSGGDEDEESDGDGDEESEGEGEGEELDYTFGAPLRLLSRSITLAESR